MPASDDDYREAYSDYFGSDAGYEHWAEMYAETGAVQDDPVTDLGLFEDFMAAYLPNETTAEFSASDWDELREMFWDEVGFEGYFDWEEFREWYDSL